MLAGKLAAKIRYLLVENEILRREHHGDETAVQFDWIVPLLQQGYFAGLKFDGKQSCNNPWLTEKSGDPAHLNVAVPRIAVSLANFLSPHLPNRTLIVWLTTLGVEGAVKYAEVIIPHISTNPADGVLLI